MGHARRYTHSYRSDSTVPALVIDGGRPPRTITGAVPSLCGKKGPMSIVVAPLQSPLRARRDLRFAPPSTAAQRPPRVFRGPRLHAPV